MEKLALDLLFAASLLVGFLLIGSACDGHAKGDRIRFWVLAPFGGLLWLLAPFVLLLRVMT